MKNTTLLLICAMALYAACTPKTQQETAQVTLTPKGTPDVVQVPAPKTEITLSVGDQMATKLGEDPNVVASLRRSPCFGNCPSYEVKLYKDGRAVYVGNKNVSRIGKYTASTSRMFQERIKMKADAIKYFSLSNIYPTHGHLVKDLPSTITYLHFGDEAKRITNNIESPKELLDYEEFIEKQFNSLEWVAEK